MNTVQANGQMKRRWLVLGLGIIVGVGLVICLIVALGRNGESQLRPEDRAQSPERESRSDDAPPRPSEDPKAPTAAVNSHAGLVMSSTSEGVVLGLEPHLRREYTRIADAAARGLYSNSKDFKTHLQMETRGYGKSPNAEIQSLLAKHNEDRATISTVKYAGRCKWLGGKDHEFTLDFKRKGFRAAISCSPGCACIRKGMAYYSDGWDPECLDTYYLLPLATFDPRAFRKIKETVIEIQDGKKKQTVAVYQAASRDTILSFDRNNNTIRRVELYDPERKKTFAQVDFTRFSKRAGAALPLRVEIRCLDKERFAEPKHVPDKMTLDVDPKSLRIMVKEASSHRSSTP
jgi:hypothetical protein